MKREFESTTSCSRWVGERSARRILIPSFLIPSGFQSHHLGFRTPISPLRRFLLSSLSQGSSKADVCCDFMSTTKGSVANHPFPYSDHEALTSELRLTVHNPTETDCGRKPGNQESATGRSANHAGLYVQ